MYTIHLSEVLGNYAITDVHASKVYDEICKVIARGDTVEIDIDDCVVIPVFINFLLFLLLKEYTIDQVRSMISWKNENDDPILNMMDELIVRANRYLTDPEYRISMDSAFDSVMDDD